MAGHTAVAVGIDVAKAQVDVAVQPTGDTWTGPRSPGGLRRLRSWLAARRPTPSCWKRPAYERAVVAGLAGLPVVVVIRARPRLRPGPRQPGQDRLMPACGRFAARCGPRCAPRLAPPSRPSRT